MGLIGNKFYIEVNGKSQEELDKRIVDNEKRGFTVHKTNKPETNTFRNVDFSVDGSGYTQYGKITKDYHTNYNAVMVRENAV